MPDNKELSKTNNSSGKKLELSSTTVLDLTGLSEEQVQELTVKYAEGMIDVKVKAAELDVDVDALKKVLDTMVDHTRQVSEQGDAITSSHTQDSSLGRTEVLMGNTEKAASGKLSRSATGEKDNTLIYLGAAIIAVVILALAFGN